MYNVSNGFKEASKQPVQEHRLTGTVGNVSFDESNVFEGSFNIQKQCTDSSGIVLGSAYIGQLTATFTGLNISRGSWVGKTVTPSFGLKVGNSWEDVPLGSYKIKEVVHTAEGTQVTAYDNMAKFDKVIKNKKATIGFVTDSMFDFVYKCCEKCHVTLATTKAEIDALPNGYRQQGDIEVYGDAGDNDFANDIETYRDLLYWCCQTMGAYATMNRYNQLVIRPYTQTVVEEINDTVRLAGAHFEDYITHFTGIYVTDMDTNDEVYYGYDASELTTQLEETAADISDINTELQDNAEAQAELERKHEAHEITDEEYAQQKAELVAEAKDLRSDKKKLEKRLGWLEQELQKAQDDDEGATLDLGANPFLQYENITKRDNTRRRVLNALANISYTPFTCPLICGAHYDLGDVIHFTGGHASDDYCCVMSWSYTHNQGTELEGFGTDSSQQQVRVRNKAEKQADRANTTASTTGHTFVAEADPDTTTGAPRSSKQGDIWVEIDETGTPGTPAMPIAQYESQSGWICETCEVDTNGNYHIKFSGTNIISTPSNLEKDFVVLRVSDAVLGEGENYSISGDISISGTLQGTWLKDRGIYIGVAPYGYAWANFGAEPEAGFHADREGQDGACHVHVTPDNPTNQHFEGILNAVSQDGYLYITTATNGFAINSEQGGHDNYWGQGTIELKNFCIKHSGVEPTPGVPDRETGKMYANDSGEWREVKRITDVDTSEAAGTDSDNGLVVTETKSQLRLKPNVMRALYKADPPQQGVNFSRFCVRYTGEPDKAIGIEPFANHTFSNIKVYADNENAFKIKCGGVGGSGSYAVYKITGLVVNAPYFFNFAYNFSDNASFGDDYTKGLGIVFNTTGTINTDSWSGDPDTFSGSTLYYSMYRSTTKHYADFSFEATATTMYMCVVLADEVSGQDVTLTMGEFVIANSERKLIRNIYLYDYSKNTWLKYRPFGSVTGGSDDGGGSTVEITPTISTGTKIADYSIDGVGGELKVPNLPIASSNTLGGIKVGQNLSIDENGVLSASGGGGGASSLNALTDVDITEPSNGQVLKYDEENEKWVNSEDEGGVEAIELTLAQYDALPEVDKLDPTKVYYIKDYPSGGTTQALAFKQLTQTQYNALSVNQKMNGTVYFISANSVGAYGLRVIEISSTDYNRLTPSEKNNNIPYFVYDD